MLTFFRYYADVLHAEDNGLKLVLGGTGLGKTSAVPNVVTHPDFSGKKFVYVANRVSLLEEMAESFARMGHPEAVVHQRRDGEIIADLLVEPTALRELLNDPLVEAYGEYAELHSLSVPSRASVGRALEELIRQPQLVRTLTAEGGPTQERLRTLMRFLRAVVRLARDARDGKLDFEGPKLTPDRHVRLRRLRDEITPVQYDTLTAHPLVRRLFPYLEFMQDANKRIFLVTLHKAFYGFFDGYQLISLTQLQEGKGTTPLVFFLDEFDFLERDLTSLLARDTEIRHPFRFVQEFCAAMRRDKLPAPGFLKNHPEWRNEIEAILSLVDQLAGYGIDFPSRSHFVRNYDETSLRKKIDSLKRRRKQVKNPDQQVALDTEVRSLYNEMLRGSALFQTRFTVYLHRLYLDQEFRKGSFNLVVEKPESQQVTAFALFNVVNQAVGRILRLFKEAQVHQPRLYASLLRYCFEASDQFQQQVATVRQYPLRQARQDTNYDKLLNNGFGAYEIEDLQDEYDPEEVRLRYYALFSTPEEILVRLARRHLVFGLSATASIHRVVQCFDHRWLRKQLAERFLETTEADWSDLAAATVRKAAERAAGRPAGTPPVRVVKAPTLDAELAEERWLKQWLASQQNLKPQHEGYDVLGNAARLARLDAWLAMLLRLSDAPETHLLFFASIRQAKWWLESFQNGPEQGPVTWRVERQTTRQDESETVGFTFYELTFRETTAVVVLYDAAKAREIHAHDAALEAYYNLFHQGKPVLLLTTYNSAGNGVNLQYHNPARSSEDRPAFPPDRDFQHVHLLDMPYYFFGKPEAGADESERAATLKANLLYLAKLSETDQITDGQFRQQLRAVRRLHEFNPEYLKTSDGRANQLATLIQALGRIERVRAPMPQQVIHLSEEAYRLFETVASEEEFEGLRADLIPCLSDNLRALFEAITRNRADLCVQQREARQENLAEVNHLTKTRLGELLRGLDQLRHHPDRADLQSFRHEWERLRQAVLRHDFTADSPLHRHACTFKSNLYDPTVRGFWMDEHLHLVPKAVAGGPYSPWVPDVAYERWKENKVLRRHFELRGYELGFRNHGHYLTPYAHQSLLLGAIGEEAVRAMFVHEDIQLADDAIPNELYELADTKLAGKPWYVDAKHYGMGTLQRFDLPPDDPFFHPKLNQAHFAMRTIEKIRQIQRAHPGQNCKLIYVNVFADDDLTLRYFRVQGDGLQSVGFDFSQAEIIWVPGMLTRQDVNVPTDAFDLFLSHLKPQLR